MMRRLIVSAVVAAGALAVGACHRAPPRAMPTPNPANMLVTTAWLAEHQNDRDLVMLHVGTKAQYDSGHIVGARHTTLDEVALPTVPGGRKTT
jgi:3-mercaptopyruvate sulfurtransferase SseA